MSAKLHRERKHSKFSASGAERWFNCPGSVELSEGMPDRESQWSKEGTLAHEVLELTIQHFRKGDDAPLFDPRTVTKEMIRHARDAALFMLLISGKAHNADFMVETRIALPFLHPDCFGTFDGAVIEHFGTLHVFDYKFGAGHAVSPGTKNKPNLQMLFYAIGLAAKYDWNFKRVRMWIIQPRIRGYDGPMFLELGVLELQAFVREFQAAIKRVLTQPGKYVEGSWCHWCKAKTKCPIKQQAKLDQAKSVFTKLPQTKGK